MTTERGGMLILLLGALGCGPSLPVPDQIDTRVSQTMGTVVEVSWTSEEPTTAFVRFGEGGELTRETAPTGPATSHTHQLVGLPPQTDIDLVVVVTDGDKEAESKVQTVTTGALEGYVPDPEIQGGPTDHFLVMPLLSRDDPRLAHMVVIDPEGRVVWTHTDDREPQVYRARLSRDGSGVVYSATVVGGSPHSDSAIVRVSWEGEELQVHSVPWLAHDFVEHEDGTLVTLASECRDAKGDPVPLANGGCPEAIEGNSLVSIAPDGTTETLWTTFDCLDPETAPSNATDRDNWTHTNALDYDEASGTYLVSMRNLDTILNVDVTTKTCAWGLGGVAGTLEVRGERFRKEHQFEWLGDTMLVFDNQGGFPDSRVIEYEFDEVTGARSVGTFVSDPPLFTLVLGDVYRTSDGATRIFWGNTGITELFDADGASVSRLKIPRVIMGFSEIAADPGRPDLGAP